MLMHNNGQTTLYKTLLMLMHNHVRQTLATVSARSNTQRSMQQAAQHAASSSSIIVHPELQKNKQQQQQLKGRWSAMWLLPVPRCVLRCLIIDRAARRSRKTHCSPASMADSIRQ
eukprot:TRINITY_DN2776_c0_g1_i1.p2 TRINITY_DN2776_c0_g1~~TRINITY_DN2776_c0_g1_i1.p2  ORF type:complete len:115 (+),score=11.17 TRINITY_DN2776_c0_g1_i1:225-569(+)